TELGKKAFVHSAPFTWNLLQKDWKLTELFFTHCLTSENFTVLEALPGGGWDNLRNVDMGRVMKFTYSQCKTTEDRVYLIPDEVFVIPQKETDLKTSSEIISSWVNQKSATSTSINADVSFFVLLNGKFSTENRKMKTAQLKNSSLIARVQVRDFLYTVKTNPDFTLDSRFVQRVKDIADAIENNQTQNAAYLSEKMVVDYGTHVITSVDAGASLVEEDYLDSKYVLDNAQQQSNIKIEASVHFFNIIKFKSSKFDGGVQNTDESSSRETYESNIKHYNIESHGGVPFYPGLTLQKWQNSIKNNLVAIDRSGVPLHHIINHNTLPDIPPSTVEKVSLSLEKAIERYYVVNTHPGCVDVNSQNFNFQANVDDGSCTATNLSFGGVYQQCDNLSNDAGPLCEKLAQKNPDTGDFSCRSPYTPTLLRSEERQEEYTKNECYDDTYRCGFLYLQHCTKQTCQDKNYVRSARIDTYWCSNTETASVHSGYLFGGLYSKDVSNPNTNSKDCPPQFIEVTFLSEGMTLCLSHDYEMGSRYAVPFGGFFSCESDNPMANNTHHCPLQFSQHLVTSSNDCEIQYCVPTMSFTGGELQDIQLPPFTIPPQIRMEANGNVMVMTEGEKNWVRVGEDKQWKLATQEEIQEIVKKMHPDYNELSGGKKTGIAFGVLALVALVVLMIVIIKIIKKRRRDHTSYAMFVNR
uniref:Macrophage-expressed gene 1 protein n=1 Tax=Periophthalmus magnuspinnatus TaxID=409849 RepID=A0A3B4A954_9GOBI